MIKAFEYIHGAAGSGKTTAVTERIISSLRQGKRVFLLVPEQEVLVAERRIADAADAANPPVSCEELNVLSFRRLANLAFRTYGGISYFSPSEGAKSVLMWQALEETAFNGQLKYYTGKRDAALVEALLSAMGELKRSGITVSALELAKNKLSDDNELKRKLHDISLIMTHYNNMMAGSYSDPADDVTRLATLLGKHKLFTDCHVYLDSFNGFTGAERAVLRHIISQASAVTIALCLPQNPPATGFETVKDTEKLLREMCDDAGVAEKCRKSTLTQRSEDYCKPAFLKLERAMRALNGALSTEDIPSAEELRALPNHSAILAVRPTDSFAEAEFTAIRIKSLVEQGARYRDIAVVGRGVDTFKGILDTALSRFDIPYFISDRRSVSDSPLFRVIMRALSLISGWHAEDMLAYLKTGMTGLSIDQIYELEKYITVWNISGYGWTSDSEWTMNPSGYTDTVTEKDMELLDTLNELRRTVRDPLMRLSEAMEGSEIGKVTLSDGCSAIYSLLISLGIANRISEEGTEEERTLYNTVIDMLDMLVGVGGSIPVSISSLLGILTMAANKTDYGAIPEATDTVTVGDAALLRAGSVKHVILLGCIDGVFPRAVADDSFFSDEEKNTMAEIGIPTSQKTEDMSDDECFYFYRSASAATETVAFSCPMQDSSGGEYQPSVGYLRALSFLGLDPDPKKNKLPPKYPDGFTVEERAYSLANAAELYRASVNTPEGAAIEEALRTTGHGELLNSSTPIKDPNATLSKEHSDMLFGGNIALNQYKIESYSSCPFKFYSSYILGLDKPKRADFSSADVGNFIHRIMEKAVGELFDKNGLKPDAKERDLNALVEETVAPVVYGILGSNARFTSRIEAMITRLKRTSTLLIRALIEEFSESRFIPTAFELDISTKKGVPPLAIPLSENISIHVYGRIDRVDTFKKGDDIYVRVVDYKTGTREHSLKNIEKGIDLQLLLYLFAICKAKKSELPPELGDIAGSVKPAGAIYQESTYPTVKYEKLPENDETAICDAIASLSKTGLVLNDEDILSAMETTVGKGTPRRIDKRTNAITVSDSSLLLNMEEIGKLVGKISDILIQLGGKLRSGNANAAPAQNIADNPCKYCDFRTFCRSAVSTD